MHSTNVDKCTKKTKVKMDLYLVSILVMVYAQFCQTRMVESFHPTDFVWFSGLADGSNLLDKRVDPGCWLKSGFESSRRQFW